MLYRIKLFAAARDIAQSDELVVTTQPEVSPSTPTQLTVRQLTSLIAAQRPELAALLAHSRISVNHAYALPDQIIPPQAEVALIPPVSGG